MISDKAISDNHTPGRATDYGTNLILQLVPINAHVCDMYLQYRSSFLWSLLIGSLRSFDLALAHT